MRRRRVRVLAGLMWLLVAAAAAQGAVAPAPGPVIRVRLDGIVDPVMARYLARVLDAAEQRGAELVILGMDTPGGLDQSMRRMVQRILNARVPVVVYVSPSGARAASAGAFISLAAPLLAMAPGTNIGAAHPVDLHGQSLSDKITNDAAAYIESLAHLRGKSERWARQAVRASISTPAAEAKALGITDIMAADVPDLLRQLDGKTVKLAGHDQILRVAGAAITDWPMQIHEQFLHGLDNPNITYILFLVGLYGLIYELAAPGAILPGVGGAICMVLALSGFDSLPISVAGIVLLLLGAGLLVLELFITSHGILAVGALVSLTLGSMMVFPSSLPPFRAATGVMASMLGTTAVFVALVVFVVIRSRKPRAVSGVESLKGARGIVKSVTAGGLLVHVRGEDWLASADTGPLPEGQDVEVIAVEGLKLKIRPVPPVSTPEKSKEA